MRSDVEEQDRVAVLERIKEIIAREGGVVVKTEEWGKKRFAYEIQHQADGYYCFLYFQSTPQTLNEVTRVLGITETVLRFRPIRHEKSFTLPQQVAEPVAAAGADSSGQV